MRSTVKAEMAAMRDLDGLLASGGVQRWEDEAAADAIRKTRKMWLSVIEGWQVDWHKHFAHRKPTANDRMDIGIISRDRPTAALARDSSLA